MSNAVALKADSPNSPEYREAPRSIEAEQALLGAILINNEAFDKVSDFLDASHFAEDIHRRIYENASALIRAGKGRLLVGFRSPPIGFCSRVSAHRPERA